MIGQGLISGALQWLVLKCVSVKEDRECVSFRKANTFMIKFTCRVKREMFKGHLTYIDDATYDH